MVKRIGSIRKKTRQKLSKSPRQRGKISITKYFQTFEAGERVQLYAEPSVPEGKYHPRFFGKMGIVLGKKGRCYEIEIKDFSKKKRLIVHPVHLLKVVR